MISCARGRCQRGAAGQVIVPAPRVERCTTPPPHRHLLLAIERPDWSPDVHAQFPDNFRVAARTLLLAAHRLDPSSSSESSSSRRRGASAAHLGVLPVETLHGVLRAAAYPVSAWL